MSSEKGGRVVPPKKRTTKKWRRVQGQETETNEYVRHGTQTLRAALEIASGQVVAHVKQRCTWNAGVDSPPWAEQLSLLATQCHQRTNKGSRKLLKMVDQAGIEPATSSMPWKYQGSRSLILKQLMAGQAGK